MKNVVKTFENPKGASPPDGKAGISTKCDKRVLEKESFPFFVDWTVYTFVLRTFEKLSSSTVASTKLLRSTRAPGFFSTTLDSSSNLVRLHVDANTSKRAAKKSLVQTEQLKGSGVGNELTIRHYREKQL